MTVEQTVTFDCEGERLIGILSPSAAKAQLGVLVLVGGPQYRVGSHRQFVLLARRLARDGIPVMRFDFRGIGDSGGAPVTFEDTSPDIAAAIDSFRLKCPSVQGVVLWGLCDAAAAALLYWRVTRDSRAAGMVLLNPWIRSEQSLATVHIKNYYTRRLLDRQFWTKLRGGGIDVIAALRGFAQTLIAASSRTKRGSVDERPFQDRMATALSDFEGPVLLILSGQDYTAKEFIEYTKTSPRWRAVIGRPNIERASLSKADHTFSTAAWREEVETLTVDWLKRSFRID